MDRVSIIFDLDDTLIITTRKYIEVNESTANLIANFLGNKVSVPEILRYQRDKDIDLVKKMGFVTERFILSWLETAKHFFEKEGYALTKEYSEKIKDSADVIHRTTLEMYPNAHGILNTLSENKVRLHLLTAGDYHLQNKRIQDANLTHFFETITVVPFKTPIVLKELLSSIAKTKDYIMVGNSLKSDIYPALENNIFALHVENKTWEIDQHDIDYSHPLYMKANDLFEAEKILVDRFI